MLMDYRNSKRVPNTLIVMYEQHFVKKRNTPYSIFNTEHSLRRRTLFILSKLPYNLMFCWNYCSYMCSDAGVF